MFEKILAQNPVKSKFLFLGLVSKVFDDQEVLLKSSLELASIMAQKSPVALQGTKVLLNYSRDHSIDESLKFTVGWSNIRE